MFKKLVLAGLVSGLFTLGAAQAQEMHRGGHHGGGYMSFLQGVTLTEAQKTQLHDIMHASYQQLRPQMQQLRSLHEQISGDLAGTAAINNAQIAALQQQAQTLQGQLDQAKLAAAMQVRELLTPDQLSQAASVHAQLETLHQQEHSVMSQAHGQPAAAE